MHMVLGERIVDLPVQRPGLVLAATALITVVLAAGLPQLSVDASIESMIVSDDPDHLAFEEKKAVFGSDEVVALAIPFNDALAPESLGIQRRIAQRIESLPQVTEVDALATTDDILGRGDTLIVEPLVPRDRHPRELEQAAEHHIRERVATNQLWSGFLISRDRKSAALQIHLDEPTHSTDDRNAVVVRIEQIAREELEGRPYYLAGHPYMKTEIARTMQRDLSIFLPVTLAVMAVFLIVGVGSLRAAGVLLIGILLSAVWMLGFMGWLGEPLTALSNAAPTILLALGTAYFMHLVASYQKEAQAGGTSAEITYRALARVRRPTVVAGVTTAIGFGSLASSKIPLIHGFGLDLAAGIMAVVVIACFSIPAAFTLLAPGSGAGILARGPGLGNFLFRVSRLDAARPRAILIGAGFVLALCVVEGSRLEVDSSGPNAFAEDEPFRVSSEFYRESLSGDVIENVYLTGAKEGDFKDPARLRRMLEFQMAAEALPQVDKSISIANYIALMNRAMHENRESEERIPDSREAVAQYLLLYSFSGDLEEFDDLVDPSYSQARIILNATVPSSSASAELRAVLSDLARKHFPGEAGSAAVLSTEILLSQAADSLAREQVRSFAAALALIVLVVAVAFRSVSAGALLLLPNGLPIALNLGVMSLLGLALSESTSVISVIALGIAVDSTVHLLAAIRGSEKARGSLPGAVVYAMQTTGRPVLVSSFIITAGFSILLLSDFQLISEFGGLTALTIVYCLGADLLVLPAQLLAWKRSREKAEESDVMIGVEHLGGTGPAPALLTFDGRSIPALLVQHSGEKASFRLLGEGSSWLGWRASSVIVTWLSRAPLSFGRITGIDEVANPVLSVEWAEEKPGPQAGGR
jgi:predicted RND superfamily exporter protein